jgi:hypothetical protein
LIAAGGGHLEPLADWEGLPLVNRYALRRKGLSPGVSRRILLGNESVLPEI